MDSDIQDQWIYQLNRLDQYYSDKVDEFISTFDGDIVDFNRVSNGYYLETKFQSLKGKECNSVTGIRYCKGHTCSCKFYMKIFSEETDSEPRGPICPQIQIYDLKKSPLIFVIDKYEPSWIDGDPLFIIVKNGQFTQVLY